MDVSLWNFLATLVLVCVTGWYAKTTAGIFGAMKRQVDATREQSELLIKSTQIAARSALLQAAGHPAGENPIPKLRELAKELETIESQRRSAE